MSLIKPTTLQDKMFALIIIYTWCDTAFWLCVNCKLNTKNLISVAKYGDFHCSVNTTTAIPRNYRWWWGVTAQDLKYGKCSCQFFISFGGTSISGMVSKTYRCSWKIVSVA